MYKKMDLFFNFYIEAILKSIVEPVIVTDINDRIVVVNEGAKKFLKSNFFTGSYLLDVIEDKDILRAILKTVIEKRSIYQDIEFEGLIYRIVSNLILDDKKKIVGTITVFHDITDLKKADILKDEFLSVISHELKTPMTAILGYLMLLFENESSRLDDVVNGYLSKVRGNVFQLYAIINNILDFSRMQRGNLDFFYEKFNISSIILDIVNNFNYFFEKNKIKVKLNIEDNIVIDGDNLRITQVITNLLSNAIKFSKNESTLIIECFKNNDSVVFRILDEAPVIPEKEKIRIFEKFYQVKAKRDTHKGGIGLGLSICKIIIERGHKGIIKTYTRDDNSGNVFEFVIPINIRIDAQKSDDDIAEKLLNYYGNFPKKHKEYIKCYEIFLCDNYDCPAYKNESDNRCFIISGAECRMKIMLNFKDKITVCKECEVYKNAEKKVQKSG